MVLIDLLNKLLGTVVGRRLRRALYPLGELTRIIIRLSGNEFFISKRIGRRGAYQFHYEYIFSDLERWGEAHNNLFEEYVSRCIDTRCVLDVGAHIGITIMPVSSVIATSGKIYGFEPSPTAFELLEKHMRANEIENVVVENVVVGDLDKNEIDYAEENRAGGGNMLATCQSKGFVVKRRMITLDSYCSNSNLEPDVIKVDVEGAELKVLRGAESILKTCSPIIFLSVHPRKLVRLGSSIDELKDYVESIGYEIYDSINGNIVSGDLFSNEYVLKVNRPAL